MNNKQIEREMLKDYEDNRPVGLLFVIVFGVLVMITVSVSIIIHLVNMIVR